MGTWVEAACAGRKLHLLCLLRRQLLRSFYRLLLSQGFGDDDQGVLRGQHAGKAEGV